MADMLESKRNREKMRISQANVENKKDREKEGAKRAKFRDEKNEGLLSKLEVSKSTKNDEIVLKLFTSFIGIF